MYPLSSATWLCCPCSERDAGSANVLCFVAQELAVLSMLETGLGRLSACSVETQAPGDHS